jgi:hypothetical protein
MSKGSAPRPLSVDTKTFDNNWDKIFGKKDKTEDVTKVYNEERLVSKEDKKSLAKEKKNASKSKRG